MTEIPISRAPAILQIIPALTTGGAERGAVDVAIAARQIGWRSYVASADGPMVYELKKAGVTHIPLPLDRKSLFAHWRNRRALQDIITRERIDLVHARSRAPAWSAWQAVQRINKGRHPNNKIHFVTTFHGTYNIDDFGIFKKWKRKYNAVMTFGERVIAVSEFIAHHIVDNYGTDPQKIIPIARGIDMVRFNPDSVTEERVIRLMQEWHVPEHKPIIMLPGRFTRWKGHVELLEALHKIRELDWYAVFVGSQKNAEPYVQELEQRIHALGLDGRVRLLPDCRDMSAAYKIANIVVCPSTDPEAFGRVPVEGQAMGCLTIASAHGGAVETVIPAPSETATGWLYPPGNIDALAECIESALGTDSFTRYQIGARGRINVASNFTKDTMCAATLNVYADVLGLQDG